jgi:hypothetical protein
VNAALRTRLLASELELNHFYRFFRSWLESTLLGGTFCSRCQHWMTADDAGCFYRAIRGYRHFDFYCAREIQLRREFGHDGLDEAFNGSFFLDLGRRRGPSGRLRKHHRLVCSQCLSPRFTSVRVYAHSTILDVSPTGINAVGMRGYGASERSVRNDTDSWLALRQHEKSGLPGRKRFLWRSGFFSARSAKSNSNTPKLAMWKCLS